MYNTLSIANTWLKGELLSETGITCQPRGILTEIPARAKEAVRNLRSWSVHYIY